VTGANLKRRIEAILTNRARLGLNRPKKLLLATAGIAALAGPIAIGIVIGVANAPPVRGQAAAVPVAQTRPAPAVPVDAASPVATAAGGPGTGPVRYEGRRLVAMLVDLDRLTFDEQSRVRQFATDFLHSRIGSTDVVAVLVADEGKIEIVQDFTDDKPVLESAILRAGAGGRHSSVSGAGKPLPSIESAANLLGGIAGKKLLVYFSSGIDRSAMDYQTGLPNAIDVLKRSNVAVYMLDARGMTPAGAAPAAAKFDGEPSVAATLVDTLNRESRNRGEPAATNAIAGLPGRHASIEIDPAGAFQTLSVPVEAAGGRVEIIAEVVRSKTDGAGATVAALRDSVEAPTEYRAKFTLGAGSYDCNLIVKERASGRMYGETIHFEVK
jgi:VWFA-related protein